MNKTLRKISILLLSFLFTIGSVIGFVPQQAIAAVLDNAITIQAMDSEGNKVLPLTAVSVDSGDSAYDALMEAADQQEIEVIAEGYNDNLGQFVSKIGDVEGDDEHYWSFLAQGEYSQVGASGYKVNNGDNLAFVFVSLENESTPDISITVSAKDAEGNSIIEETNVTIDSRSSAYDALYQAASKSSVELNVSVDDQYFTFINNIGNQNLGDTDYWNLAVNGEDSQNGAITTLLYDGDHVQLEVKSFEAPEPEEPTEPSEPEGPTDPEQPTKPEEPTDSEEPTDPEQPTEPSEQEGPTEPEQPTEPEDSPSQVDVAVRIQGILNYIDSKNISFEYFSEWWIWSLSHIDFDVPTSYIDSLENTIKENEGKLDGLELQKVIIALSLQGEDATDFAGYNLVDNMSEQKRRAINDYIYTLLAIDSNDYEVAEGTREGLIDAILTEENINGGWALFGDAPSVDITGMALSSLAPYQDNSEVKAAIDRAVSYMSEAQEENGGYFEKFNGGDTSESVSQAIIGLVSVGIDPTSKAFTKPGGNLLQHLAEFKQEDEGYSHRIQDTKSMAMSTQQALLAYVAYNNSVEGSGSVYQNPNPVVPPHDSIDVSQKIQRILKYIEAKNISFEYFSEWWIWSLSHIEFDVPASYTDSLINVVKENEGRLDGLELQKIVIALSLQGKDATNFAGYNLVNNMLEQKRRAINDYIYTLLAIDSNDYEVAEGTREALIDSILAEEKENGGWSFFGDTPSIDITGMALSSLAPYQNRADVKAAIDRAVTIMSEMQEDNGGYFEKFNGGDSSESVSQAIIGLVSVGVDPTSKAFTKVDGNLLQHLAEFKQEDEGYSHLIKDTKSMAMSTQQALLAYVAYEKFIEKTGSVYQNSNYTEEPGEDGTKPEEDSTEPEEDGTKPEEDGTKPGEPSNQNKPGEKLPSTSLEIGNYVILGFLAITMGLVIAYFNRKRHNKI